MTLTIKRVFEILDEEDKKLVDDEYNGKEDRNTNGRHHAITEIKRKLINEIGYKDYYTLIHYGFFDK